MYILQKYQKEMLQVKNTVTEMKIAFDGLINRLKTTEDMTIKLPKAKSKQSFRGGGWRSTEYPITMEKQQKI